MSGLAVRCWGPPAGAPVVFLHGLFGTSDEWTQMAALLPGVRALAFDLPGHGASVGLPDHAYTIAGAVESVMNGLRFAGVTRCMLVGYSMGGRLAMHLALKYPANFPHLMLESAHPGLPNPEERALRLRLDSERANALTRDFRGFLGSWYSQPLFETTAPIREMLIERRLRGRPAELSRALRGLSTGNQQNLRERLLASPVSTTVVAGALDAKYSALARELGGQASSLKVSIVCKAGHNVHLEQPHAFADVLRAHIHS